MQERASISDFKGVALDVHRARLPDGYFQVDQNGDRSDRGTWKPRRGYKHSDHASPGSYAVETMQGVELPGGDHGLLTVDANGVCKAWLNTDVQDTGINGAYATLSSALNTTHRYTSAEYKRRVYLSNGWGPMKRWDGHATSLEDAGIAGPSQDLDSWTPSPSESAGDCEVGIHRVRYRYLDSRSGYVSNPSEEREVEVTSTNGTLTFNVNTSGASNIIRSSDSKVDRIVIEMTTVGSTVFYKAAEALESASTIAVSISDAELRTTFLPWPEGGMGVPPIAQHVVAHRERLWLFGQLDHSTGDATFAASVDVVEGSTDPDWNDDVFGDNSTKFPSVRWLMQRVVSSTPEPPPYEISHYDSGATKIVLKEAFAGTTGTDVSYRIFSEANVIWVSQPGFPEGFAPLLFLNAPNSEGAGKLTAGVGFGQSMLFFTARGCYRLSWAQGPLVDPQWTEISTVYGAVNQRCVVEVEGTIYSLDRNGIQAFSGVNPQHISDPVDSIFTDSVDWSTSDNWHATYYPKTRSIRWHVNYTSDSSTYPQRYVELDLDTGAWGTGYYEAEMSESKLVSGSTGLKNLLASYPANNVSYIEVADVGTADGPESDMTHLTVGAGATTTNIPISGTTLDTENVGLDGLYAYWVEGDQSRVISANSSSALTVAAFGSAPAENDTIWVGRIQAKLKTRAFGSPRSGLTKVFRPRFGWLQFEPLSSQRYARLRVYSDYGATARTWASSADRLDLPGLTYPGRPLSGVRVQDSDGEYRDWLVDATYAGGVVRSPLGSEFKRVVELEVEIDEPDAQIEMFGLTVDGDEALERLA